MKARIVLAVFTLVVAACSGGDAAPTTSSTTTVVTSSTTTTTAVPVTTTTTTTTIPSGPPIAQRGDENETVEAIQFLLNCTGYGDLTVDGEFGSGTVTAVNLAQEALGRAVNEQVDEDTFADLSRACAEAREVDASDAPVSLVGNAATGDPEVFAVDVPTKGVLSATLSPAADLVVTLLAPDLTIVLPAEDDVLQWEVSAGVHTLQIEPALDVTTFLLDIDLLSGAELSGEWIITTDGLRYGDTELEIGDDADTVIDFLYDTLGHGPRGPYDEFDTGWYEITDPQSLGLRGVYIEGLALLFFGPHAGEPGRAETLARVRFEGPSDDAEGNPRPENYVTTELGITVGDTLADLEAAYPSGSTGSNSDEHYFRITDSGGELCFYFGSTAPTDTSTILEIATECRD